MVARVVGGAEKRKGRETKMFGDPWGVFGSNLPNVSDAGNTDIFLGNQPVYSQPAGDVPWWAVLGPSIIATAGKDVQSILGNQYQGLSQPRVVYPTGYQGAGQYPYSGSPASSPDALMNWVSKNWWILAIGGLILFFPGFQRRRNPASARRANPRRRSSARRKHRAKSRRRR